MLVDFENDSVQTALDVARALGPRLWGVRLDTSGQLVDRSLWDEMGDFDPRGVNERLVWKVREALDRDGFERVRIVVSGGFDAERIGAFESRGVPVDSYGVGSSLIRGENDFTGDIVMTDGRPSAKIGRRFRAEPAAGARRVKRVLWDVDTQVDFMLPEGKLYVPGAERTAPAMARLVSAAREAGIVHVASADDHELTDPEISRRSRTSADTYPPHCLRGTRGAAEGSRDRGSPIRCRSRSCPTRLA